MSTGIGPQIPAHLLKQFQPSNDSQSSDDDDIEGPQPEPEHTHSTSIGPQIPSASVAQTFTRKDDGGEGDASEEDEEAFAPALPPDLVRPSKSSTTPTTKQPVGPSLPHHPSPIPTHNQNPNTNVNANTTANSNSDDSDSDSDSGDYGPMPLPSGSNSQSTHTDGLSEGVREFIEREERRKREVEEAARPKKAVREEWMLVPPSSSDVMGHLSDPTKLKARQFSRSSAPSVRGAPNNLWTETPAERAQRIADEVSGKKRRAVDVAADDGGKGGDGDKARKKRRDEELRRVVEEHNKSARAKSLLSMHQSTSSTSSNPSSSSKDKDKDKEKEGPPGVWDHARDMALGGRLMDDKQRGKMIADAKALGERFGSGKGGGYL